MTATRLEEFATGTGTSVLVDSRLVPAPAGGKVAQAFVHVSPDCPRRSKAVIGRYPTERMARAAIPHLKACKTCRTTQ